MAQRKILCDVPLAITVKPSDKRCHKQPFQINNVMDRLHPEAVGGRELSLSSTELFGIFQLTVDGVFLGFFAHRTSEWNCLTPNGVTVVHSRHPSRSQYMMATGTGRDYQHIHHINFISEKLRCQHLLRCQKITGGLQLVWFDLVIIKVHPSHHP